ncbi:MAG: beta-N-acetylhexosaminidase [Clostridia bacterium]|nr:beta-N-acetylhexosaminidase [Clostridia bacterium]
MPKNITVFLAASILIGIIAFSGFGCSEEAKTDTAVIIVEEETEQIEEIIGSMTLRQKVCQLLVVGLEETSVNQALRERWRNYPFGGVIIFERNIIREDWLTEFTADLQALSAPERALLICVDEEGGAVTRIPGELFPAAVSMARLSEGEVYMIGERMADKLLACGVNMNLAPVLDANLDSRNEVIGNRSFGSDPELVSRYGIALFSGMIDKGVIPVGKHFPGHGSTLVDSHYTMPVLDKSKEELFDLELIPFREAVKAGIPVIMTGHIVVSGLDQKPATMSNKVIELLRVDLSFDGVIISDDLEMAALTDNYNWEEIILDTFMAGVDLLLIGHNSDRQDEAVHILEKAYGEGIITDERLNSSLSRILNLQKKFNLIPDSSN